MIERVFDLLFGSGRNALRDTVEVFRENAEQGAAREAGMRRQIIAQYGAEFDGDSGGLFDRFIDALNRLPRPLLAFGTLGLFLAAMLDPIWFAQRMQGIALVPEPLWWLLGAIVSFYFGARQQMKGQQFQRQIVQSLAQVPRVVENVAALRTLDAQSPGVAGTGHDAELALGVLAPDPNDALAAWHRRVDANPR